MNGDEVYLEHILDSIKKIEDFTKGLSRGDFLSSIEKQDSVTRRLEIIGEAVKNLSLKLKSSHPEIEWKKITGTRDILIHAYFSVDEELLWDIVEKKLSILKKQIKKILKEKATSANEQRNKENRVKGKK